MRKTTLHFVSYITAVAAVTAISSCARRPVSDDEIAASWGDTAMTVAQFKDKMNVRYMNESNAMNREYQDRINVIEEYVIRDCKLLEGRRLGFDQRDDIRKAYDDATERKATDLLYYDHVRAGFITEDMIRDFWEHAGVEVHCRHLLIEMPEGVTGKDTLAYWNRINSIYEKAKGGENFERLVDLYSEDRTIDQSLHGDLGVFRWGKMVDEFQEAAWALKPGEISPPVRSRYGYHLIQMIEKRSSYLEASTSHILVKVSRRATPAESTLAWDRATMILEQARKPGADFAQLARRYSEDEKTWVNGRVGWIARGSMPDEYWEAAFRMKPGEVAGPVRTYKGYHIVKLHELRDEPKPISDPDEREQTYARLERIYRDTLEVIARAFVDSMKSASEAKYNQEVVKLLLRRLSDTTLPENMSPFSAFTPEERELLVVSDKLGGLKINDLVEGYSDFRLPPDSRGDSQYIENMVDAVTVPKYLAETAHQEGYFDRPQVIKEGVRALDNAMLPEIEREMIYNKGTPTEEEIKKYYQEHIDEFTVGPSATVWEIMVNDRKLAEQLLERVNKGEDISTLARRYTQRTKTKHRGGKLGPFTIDQYGPVSRRAFDLEPGQVAGPIEAGDAFSIIKLIEKKPQEVKSLDDARSQLESDLRFKTQKGLKEAWEAELRRQYNVKIYENVVKRVWPIVQPLPEEVAKERKKLSAEREEQAKKMKTSAEEDKIQLKLKPNTEQEFITKEGKKVTVKIGEPKYLDKEGKEIEPAKAKIKLTPQGKLKVKESGEEVKPTIKIEPKGKPK